MAEYPDNLPVCWWTPIGYELGALPAPFVQACKSESGDWRKELERAGYEHWINTSDPDCSNYAVTGWRHQGDGRTPPHIAFELWDTSEQLAVMCVGWQHQAAFLFDKWPDLTRKQRQMDEPSLNKAIIAFIRHGHSETTIDRYGQENFEERRNGMSAETRAREAREQAKKASAS